MTIFSRIFRIAALCISLSALAVAMPARAADTYARTTYPIVLVHGMLGTGSVGSSDYFYGVPAALRKSGAVVFAPSVSALNSSEVRGEELLSYLRSLKAAYGYSKFNLIGHSHGGQTMRYVAAVAPDLVASVTTVGTPHQGSGVADLVQKATGSTGTTGVAAKLADLYGKLIDYLAGSPQLPQNSLGTLASLSTAGAQAFNARFPQAGPWQACGQGPGVVNNIRYYSVGGTKAVTNVLDYTDLFLGAASLVLRDSANDGVVERCSNHWGFVLRDDYPWNHLDEVNQSYGLRGAFTPDPVAFYRTQANRLKVAGL